MILGFLSTDGRPVYQVLDSWIGNGKDFVDLRVSRYGQPSSAIRLWNLILGFEVSNFGNVLVPFDVCSSVVHFGITLKSVPKP